MAKKSKSLLESDSESDSDSDSDSSTNNSNDNKKNADKKPSVSFSINSKFAKDYQSRKQQEELAKDRERRQRHGEDSDDNSDSDDASTSSSEDEDGELLTAQLDTTILKTINALRNKDETIYNSNVRFFRGSDEESSDNDDNAAPKRKRTAKPKRAKDVIREQILEQMKEEEEEEATGGSSNDKRKASQDEKTSRLAYDEQQQELRQAFLDENKNSDDNDNDNDSSNSEEDSNSENEDNFLVIKKRHNNDNEEDEETKQTFQRELQQLEESVLNKKNGNAQTTTPSTLVDPRGEVEDGEKFLLDFIKNKTWIDKSDKYDADNSEDDASLEALEHADEFENKYNFRFEEAMQQAEANANSGANHSVMGYARSQTMNTLRRKDETRRDKRLARKERKAAERKAKEEKLRRLKNAKREELEQKMKQVKSVLGAKAANEANSTDATNDKDLEEGHPFKNGAPPMDEAAIMKLLEGDYDPEKFEKSMQEAFGDDFYEKEDEEWKTDEDVRKTLQKDGDVTMVDYGDDVEGAGDDEGEEPYAGDDYDEQGDGEENYDEEGEDGYDQEEDHGNESHLEKKVRAKLTDKLYELDYEDIVAGMPTRFKYREVEANDYGLSTQEILLARDQTLKQFVSLKKMAPYNEGEEYHVSSRKRRKFREMLQQDIEDAENRMKEQGITVNDNHSTEDGGDVDAGGKKKKRRRMKKNSGKEKTPESLENKPEVKSEMEDLNEDGKDESKKKRRRKKKGKKISAADASKPHTTDTSKLLVSTDKDSASKETLETVTAKKAVDKELSKSSEKSQKKKKKKSKDKKAAKVKGVSASRLASYDL